jgi:hypothetical protein
MLGDNVLDNMHPVARYLYPDNEIALAVTLEACERLVLIRRLQHRRTGYYRLKLPEICLPQYCVYLASDARERGQESPRLDQELQYRPTPQDYLVRYKKAGA